MIESIRKQIAIRMLNSNELSTNGIISDFFKEFSELTIDTEIEIQIVKNNFDLFKEHIDQNILAERCYGVSRIIVLCLIYGRLEYFKYCIELAHQSKIWYYKSYVEVLYYADDCKELIDILYQSLLETGYDLPKNIKVN
jgi:hypothetical protein